MWVVKNIAISALVRVNQSTTNQLDLAPLHAGKITGLRIGVFMIGFLWTFYGFSGERASSDSGWSQMLIYSSHERMSLWHHCKKYEYWRLTDLRALHTFWKISNRHNSQTERPTHFVFCCIPLESETRISQLVFPSWKSGCSQNSKFPLGNTTKIAAVNHPLSFEIPTKRNPREYPHIPCIFRN